MSLKDKNIVEPLVLSGIDDAVIDSCTFTDAKLQGKVAITLKNCKRIKIIDCAFKGCGCIYAVSCSDLQVLSCKADDIMCKFPRGQFFQANGCQGPIIVSGNEIHCDNPFRNETEDIINFYKTEGADDRPCVVSSNYISNRGASSKTGGGIMLGNGAPSSWQFAFDNVLVNPGQYGIAVSGGNNFKISGNQVYSERTAISNVGIYAWNQTDKPCKDVEIAGNKVNWTSKSGEKNGWWDGGNVGGLIIKNNDFKWLGKPNAVNDSEPDPKVTFKREAGKLMSILIEF